MHVYYANDLTDAAQYREVVIVAVDDAHARALAHEKENDAQNDVWTNPAHTEFAIFAKATANVTADVMAASKRP